MEIQDNHNLNDVYNRLEELTGLVEKHEKPASFIDRYGPYIVALFVPAFLALANYVTMGNTVDSLVTSMAKKAEKQETELRLEYLSTRIDNLREMHISDKEDTKKALERLDDKMNKAMELLLQIAKSIEVKK